MIAIFLPHQRRENIDRARAIVANLDASLISPHPRPVGWTAAWVHLPGATPNSVAAWLVQHTCSTVIMDGPPAYARAAAEVGVRVAVIAEPGGVSGGERGSAYAYADAILAPWAPQGLDLGWPARWRDRILHLGAIGWQAAVHTTAPSTARRSGGRWHCLALSPRAAGPGPRERLAIVVETPAWRWTFAQEQELLEEGPVWTALATSEVAVCHPTSPTIAALAATRTPALMVLPERASHAQEWLAETAALTAPVHVVRGWPRAGEWPTILERVRGLDGQRWGSWSQAAGLARLAAFADSEDPSSALRVGSTAARTETVTPASAHTSLAGSPVQAVSIRRSATQTASRGALGPITT
ncbi:MAG: hypothetical protein JWQ32_3609 [Marmoricola sp.]|nr:hypothetical protein [Marmoricola sp.]